jgi:hypothetical protein
LSTEIFPHFRCGYVVSKFPRRTGNKCWRQKYAATKPTKNKGPVNKVLIKALGTYNVSRARSVALKITIFNRIQ